MELMNIRQEIDRIDEELVRLICKRLDYSRQSATYKKEHGLNVFFEDREREVLEAVTAQADALDKDGYGYGIANRLIYSTVVEVSRSLQYKMLGAGQNLRDILDAAQNTWVTPTRVICHGVRGTSSDEAAEAIFPNIEPTFVNSRNDVINAIKNGQADYGLLPVRDEPFYSMLDFVAANGCYVAARIYIKESSIIKGRVTQFVLVSPNLLSMPDANHTILRFSLPHAAGALYHTIGRLALEGLNMRSLHTRTLENEECVFYLGFDGNIKNPRTADLLCALSEELDHFVLYGNYHEYVIQ